MNGEYMLAEIREQPAVFERILSSDRKSIRDVAAALRAQGIRFVLFVAGVPPTTLLFPQNT